MKKHRGRTTVILLTGLAALWTTVPAQAAVQSQKEVKKEMVQYATGPGGETNPEVLATREVKVKKPDSDGVAAVKTVGGFVVDFVSMPFKIVKAIWETAVD